MRARSNWRSRKRNGITIHTAQHKHTNTATPQHHRSRFTPTSNTDLLHSAPSATNSIPFPPPSVTFSCGVGNSPHYHHTAPLSSPVCPTMNFSKATRGGASTRLPSKQQHSLSNVKSEKTRDLEQAKELPQSSDSAQSVQLAHKSRQ